MKDMLMNNTEYSTKEEFIGMHGRSVLDNSFLLVWHHYELSLL